MAHKGATFRAKLGARGRLVLPAELRRHLGLEEGSEVFLELGSSGTLIIEPVRDRVARMRGAYRSLGPGLVDELIEDRKNESAADHDATEGRAATVRLADRRR